MKGLKSKTTMTTSLRNGPMPRPLYLLLFLGGPLTKHQSTLIGWPIKSCPFSPSIAAWASLYVSYSTSAYPCMRKRRHCSNGMGSKAARQGSPMTSMHMTRAYIKSMCHRKLIFRCGIKKTCYATMNFTFKVISHC